MEPKQAPDFNRARVSGRLENMQQRWMPDGSLALIATLMTTRPLLGPAGTNTQDKQPMPLRAHGDIAQTLLNLDGKQVLIDGCLRRRFYSKDNNPTWGQVELWVDACKLTDS